MVSKIGFIGLALVLTGCELPNEGGTQVSPLTQPSSTPSASPSPVPAPSSSPSPIPSPPSPIPSPSVTPPTQVSDLECTGLALGNHLSYSVLAYSDGSKTISCVVDPTPPHAVVTTTHDYAADQVPAQDICSVFYQSGFLVSSYQHYEFSVVNSVPKLILTLPTTQVPISIACTEQ